MCDYSPVERSSDLDSHGLAPAVEPGGCAQPDGHGMEELRGSNSLSSPIIEISTTSSQKAAALRRLSDTAILRTAVDRELSLSPIANLFWNARERRLRAGWRLLVLLVIVLVVAAVDGRVQAGLAGAPPRPL